MLFLTALIGLTGFTALLIVYPPTFLASWLELEGENGRQIFHFRLMIIAIAAAHFILAAGIEVSIRQDKMAFLKSNF